MSPTPEQGDNLGATSQTGQLTEQPSPVPESEGASPRPEEQPSITELEQRQLESQPEEGTPEPPQAAEQPTTPSPEIPDKFRGKTLEDVIEMYKNVEKFAGELAQQKGQLEQAVRQIQTAQPPPQAQVQQQPQPGISPEELRNAMDRYVEGDPAPLAQLQTRAINQGVQVELHRQRQEYDRRQADAYRQVLGQLESRGDLAYRKFALAKGVPYEDVVMRVNSEFQKDAQLQQRVFGAPQSITDQELDQQVERLYSQSLNTEESRILSAVRKAYPTLTPDAAQRIVDAQKGAAATAVHTSSANRQPQTNAEGRPPEHEAELQRLGI